MSARLLTIAKLLTLASYLPRGEALTTDSNVEAEEIDLETIAALWMGDAGKQDETAEGEAGAENPEEGGEEGASSEGPQGSSTAQIEITPEMRAQIAREELDALTARARQAKEQRELKELLSSGDDTAIAEWTRKQLAEEESSQRLNELVNESTGKYATQLLEAILTPDFVESLTEEEAKQVDPASFSGSDADYLKLLTDIRASKARNGLFDEAEVERRVQERLKGQQNVQRGQQFTSASVTQLPPSGEADRHAGLDGNELKASLWQEVAEGWNNDE